MLEIICGEQNFERLMFHWNFVVRNVFNYLIVYRVLGLIDYNEMEGLHEEPESEQGNE
jgi:hypothetical protein